MTLKIEDTPTLSPPESAAQSAPTKDFNFQSLELFYSNFYKKFLVGFIYLTLNLNFVI